MFKLINKITGKEVGTYSTKAVARKYRDIYDNKHGSYVHYIVEA